MAVAAQKENEQDGCINWSKVAEQVDLKSAKEAMSEFMKLGADDLRRSLKFHRLNVTKPETNAPNLKDTTPFCQVDHYFFQCDML